MQLPLKDFLKFKWGIRERIVIDIKDELDARVYKYITESGELSEAIAHIQIEEDRPNIISIWKPNEWKSAYQKYQEDKIKSEQRMQYADAEKECIAYMEKLIYEKFGMVVGASMAPTMARDIVKNKKTNSAMMFGAEREKLIW